jgi:hypothetical protein
MPDRLTPDRTRRRSALSVLMIQANSMPACELLQPQWRKKYIMSKNSLL